MKPKNKIYAVIDTNVLVSNFFSKSGNSNPAIVINQVVEGNIIPMINEQILNEYKNVLTRQYFNFPPDLINALFNLIIESGVMVEKVEITDEIFPDKDDIVFYEVKMAVDDSYLVTGNLKHFPKKPFVVTPAQMVEILKEKGFIV